MRATPIAALDGTNLKLEIYHPRILGFVVTFGRTRRWMALMLAALVLVVAGSRLLSARDLGQWTAVDPAVSYWFRSLMQPDNPTISCCGAADAYYADEFESDGDHYVAVVTDTRDDAMLGRHHVAPGTRITVPNYKLKTDSGNPTGHGVIFLSTSDTVFCYVAPGGT